MSQTQEFPFDIEYVVQLLNLRIRRRCADGVYTDCPFCGDNRGKMKVNYTKNVWRCNYCNESGGMLKLYAMAKNISTSEAKREICDTILNGDCWNGWSSQEQLAIKNPPKRIQESTLAEIPVIHNTLTALLGMLRLSEQHREHLRVKRGLTDEEIERLGYKSTPPFYMCKPLTDRLISQGYTIKGVPGFYQKNGQWTVCFSTILAGILIPVRGVDGLLRGCQIRLDTPLKDDKSTDKEGAKYVWLSSSGKPMGTSSGSPVHYVGEPNARVVYLTEGILKADIAHILMNRTFAGVAGISNTAQLDLLLTYLAENGTQTIIAAPDIDRFRNKNVCLGVSKIGVMVRRHGLDFRMLFWNPNYKGIDDWQLALKRKSTVKEERMTNFKKRFIYGLCDFEAIDEEVSVWHESKEYDCKLKEFLGLTDEEYSIWLQNGNTKLEKLLLSQRRMQKYRIYQLDISDGKVIPFAFGGIQYLHKAGYEYPPASEYRLVHDGVLLYVQNEDEHCRLTRLAQMYGDELPKDYIGRSIAPSDVIELYDDTERKYFYRDENGFWAVKFSPILAKPLVK